MSEVRRLDFTGNPSAGESEINEWTKNKTNGKISKLFGSGDYYIMKKHNDIIDYLK